MRLAAFLVGMCLVFSACQQTQSTLSVGVQPSIEQTILANVAAQLIEANTEFRVRMVECADSYDCAGGLISGEIDFIVDYSGSGLKFVSAKRAAAEGTFEKVERRYRQLGFEWLEPLGFDGRYLLILPSESAGTLGLRSIEDLSQLKDGVKITAPSSYWHRPVDGLPALIRHYGLKLRGKPLLIEDPFKRLLAVHQGQADVAIVTATDGALQDISYTSLEDTLNFYPNYDAAIVTRTQMVDSYPRVVAVLAQLKNRITRKVMQGMNYRVGIEGVPPEIAANNFLRKEQLIKTITPSFQTRKPEMMIAVDEPDRVGGLNTFVVRVVREVFPDHRVTLKREEDAVEAVVQGKARLALIGADRFFPESEGKQFEKRDRRIEAAAVLDIAYLHIVRRKDVVKTEDVFNGTIGIGLPGTTRARLASLILQAGNKKPSVYAETKELLKQLRSKKIDVALIFELPEHAVLNEALSGGELRLLGLPKAIETHAPFLSAVRIPGGRFPGQLDPVDTVGVQIVLASPSPNIDPGPLGGGPAAALLKQNPPLTVEQANALAQAIGNPEPPDPMLPSVWVRSVVEARGTRIEDLRENLLDTMLNVGVIIFLGWVGMLIIRRPTV